MSEENKALVRRYLEAVDDNESGNWEILDEFLAPDFVSHGGLPPEVGSDRDGVKRAAELFREATPGKHVIVDQVAEGDRVVSRIRGSGQHAGEHPPGVPASVRMSRSMALLSTGSRTERSSNTGQLWTWRLFSSRSARCPRLPRRRGRPKRW